MTDNKPVQLRSGSAAFMTATLTGFQPDGADFDYTVTDASARQRAILFFESLAGRDR